MINSGSFTLTWLKLLSGPKLKIMLDSCPNMSYQDFRSDDSLFSDSNSEAKSQTSSEIPVHSKQPHTRFMSWKFLDTILADVLPCGIEYRKRRPEGPKEKSKCCKSSPEKEIDFWWSLWFWQRKVSVFHQWWRSYKRRTICSGSHDLNKLFNGKSVLFGENEISWALLVKDVIYSNVRQIKYWSERSRLFGSRWHVCDRSRQSRQACRSRRSWFPKLRMSLLIVSTWLSLSC